MSPLEFIYKNHAGETALRRVIPGRIWWGTTDYYPEAQWLLTAYDLDRQAERTFALTSIIQPPREIEE